MSYGRRIQEELREPERALRRAIPEVYDGHRRLQAAAFASGALDVKTKELIALAIAVTNQCDGCIAAHARRAVRRGAVEEGLLKPSAWPSPWAVARALSTGRELLQRSRSLQLRLEPGTGRRRVRPTDPPSTGSRFVATKKALPVAERWATGQPQGGGVLDQGPDYLSSRRKTDQRASECAGIDSIIAIATTQLGAMFAADGHARRLDRRTNHDPPRMQIHFDKALPLGGCEHSQCESVSSQGVHGRLRPAAQPIRSRSAREGGPAATRRHPKPSLPSSARCSSRGGGKAPDRRDPAGTSGPRS